MKEEPLKHKYSEIIDEPPSCDTNTSVIQTVDTPLTIKKSIQYESVIDLCVFNRNNSKFEKHVSISEPQKKNSSSGLEKSKIYKKSILQHVGYRLSTRKDLHDKRRKIADIMFILGALGVLLMIWLTELNFSKQFEIKKKSILDKEKLIEKYPYWDQSDQAIMLKCLISLSTMILVMLVFLYHNIDMQIYCVDNSIEDWRIAVTPWRIISVIFECIICAIHPIPGDTIIQWTNEEIISKQINNSTITSINTVTDSIPLDIVLSVPMFARLYLLPRIILLHSKLVTDASSQSLGYLNRITFNFRFVFKAFMNQSPEYTLIFLIVILFLVASWGLKACEYHANSEKFGFLNSMWFVAITFLTVGYGDLYPRTYCGRTISVLSGLFGVFCTALLVALVSCKLEFTRAEKYVYQFLTEIELQKQLRDSAANLIKQGWLLFKLRRFKKSLNNNDNNDNNNYNNKSGLTNDFIKVQRKLLMNIQKIHAIKHEKTKILDNSVTVMELAKQQRDSMIIIEKLCKITEKLEKKVDKIETKLDSFDNQLKLIYDNLNRH